MQALAEAIEGLPDDQRRVVMMRHVDEMSHGEIAKKIDRSVAAVRMLWVRALQSLGKSDGPTQSVVNIARVIGLSLASFRNPVDYFRLPFLFRDTGLGYASNVSRNFARIAGFESAMFLDSCGSVS